MRVITIVIFFLSLQYIEAQDATLTQHLQKFTEVKGFDGISINLIKSNENKAVITGENIDNVAIVNNDGILKIRMEIFKIFSGYRTYVDLYHSEELVVIDVNEDARISSDDTYVQDVLELKAQEGGELEINCELDQLLVKAVSGGGHVNEFTLVLPRR